MTTPEKLREQALQLARDADKNTASRRRTRIIIALLVLLGAANVLLLAQKVDRNAERIQKNATDAQVAKNKADIAKLLVSRNAGRQMSTLRLARGTRSKVERTNTVLRREGFAVPGGRGPIGAGGARGGTGSAGTASVVPGPAGADSTVAGPMGLACPPSNPLCRGPMGDASTVPGPPGPPGSDGTDGSDGADAPPPTDEQVAAAVAAQLPAAVAAFCSMPGNCGTPPAP